MVFYLMFTFFQQEILSNGVLQVAGMVHIIYSRVQVLRGLTPAPSLELLCVPPPHRQIHRLYSGK